MADDEPDQEYEVSGNETMASIAAKLDTVPSALAAYNKMASRYVYPGMKLKIPPKEAPAGPDRASARSSTTSAPEEPEMIDRQFVRVNVRHVTEAGRGVVRGGLLLTPKVLMFNPSPNDELIVESGADLDEFQLVFPLELIVNLTILKEFVRFRTNGENDEPEQVEEIIYYNSDDTDDVTGVGDAKLADDLDDGHPLYLRLIMGKPIAKKLPRSTPIISYGEQHLEPQYWFIVSPSRSLQLYRFIRRTFEPYKYGRLILHEVEKTGYELIREGVEAVEAEAGRTCTRETIRKQIKKNLTVTSLDFADISEMVGGESELVDFEQRLQLARVMPPARTDGHNWVLKFSTTRNGFNLNSLVRKLSDVSGPVLILISAVEDSGKTFGAFLSSAPTSFSEHFQGTGETFVFTFQPEFKKFSWTGENNFFYRVNQESLIVGSGDGNFAIWIDHDLNQGRTRPCSTFDSTPLTKNEDFTLKILECWAFEM